jgi:outer membrane protein OmpA-like peptidoglycan-associated protein/tetratricopeptide (TPR) repeat protein
MKRTLILCLIMLSTWLSHAQTRTKLDDLSPKDKKAYADAKAAAAKGHLKKSTKIYTKLNMAYPDCPDITARLAANYYSAKDIQRAERLFSEIAARFPDFDPEVYFTLATIQEEQKNYLASATNWDKYVQYSTNVPKVDRAKQNATRMRFVDQAIKNPVPFNPVSLGDGINTDAHEYLPVLSIDETAIVFTRRISQEDFYGASRSNKDNLFNTAQPLTGMNTHQNEAGLTISEDGKYMIFTACDRSDSYGGCDLYFSVFEDGDFSKPLNMGNRINTAAWESQPSLSPDGRVLYFASNRLGTLGANDIWMTYRNDKGIWIDPINLGETINTRSNDESPFIHPDGQTLYFRSDGRVGMGLFDIYYARKKDNQWTEPINIGYPINTEGAEGGLTVSARGNRAYYSSDIDPKTKINRKNLDIYTFELPREAQAAATTLIIGNVIDDKTKKALSASITLRDLSTGNDVYVTTTDPNTGKFTTTISIGKQYAVIAQSQGYVYNTTSFDLMDYKDLDKPFYLIISLSPLPSKTSTPKTYVLNNLFFQTGSATLLPTSETEISLIYELMSTQPEIKVHIIGHTDDIGQEEDNMDLSRRRAAAVLQALIARGIAPPRLTSDGKGESQPIDTNTTPEGRQKNRRTEFQILY